MRKKLVKYTYDDLLEVKKAYNENFEKLMKAKVGSKKHDKYAQEEKRLYRKELKIRQHLGLP